MRSIHVIPLGDDTATSGDAYDGTLVKALRDGNMDALAELYRRYASACIAVAYRLLQSKEAAEDVVHDVYVGLPEAVRKYDERGKFSPWVRQVTARVALSVLRREDLAARPITADRSVAGIDVHARMTLESAVSALPASLRTVLVLKEIEGFSHTEIASMLGISRGASEVRLHRALSQLRESIMRGERDS